MEARGQMVMRLADKVAIISGSASGMGAATARIFARAKAPRGIVNLTEPGGLFAAPLG